MSYRAIFLCLTIFVLGLFISSCRGENDYARLLHAESLVDSLPDSAKNVLTCISYETLKDDRDRALYALVNEEIIYKFREKNTNDSQIEFAISKFREERDKIRLMKGLFQSSQIKFNKGEFKESIKGALESLDIAREENNAEYLAKINEHIADILCVNFCSIEGIQYREEAIKYYDSIGRDRNRMFAIVDKAKDLRNFENYDSSLIVLDQLIPKIPKEDTTLMCYAYQTKLDPLLALGKNKSALKLWDTIQALSAGGTFYPDVRRWLDVAVANNEQEIFFLL